MSKAWEKLKDFLPWAFSNLMYRKQSLMKRQLKRSVVVVEGGYMQSCVNPISSDDLQSHYRQEVIYQKIFLKTALRGASGLKNLSGRV